MVFCLLFSPVFHIGVPVDKVDADCFGVMAVVKAKAPTIPNTCSKEESSKSYVFTSHLYRIPHISPSHIQRIHTPTYCED